MNLKKLTLYSACLLGVCVASPALADEFVCTPVAISMYNQGSPGRIHVECSTSVAIGTNNIRFFAVPTIASADQNYASRVLSTYTTALISSRKLTISYTASDTSGASWGCGATDCRSAWAVSIR